VANVAGGFVYFSGADYTGRIWAYSLEGELQWIAAYGPEGKKSQGEPAVTPVIGDGRLFVVSNPAVLYAMDVRSGKVLWSADLKELGDRPAGGKTQSPLFDRGRVIVSIRSKADEHPSFLAFRAEDGKLLWQGSLGPCKTGEGWSDTHSSPVLLETGKRRLVVNQFYRGLGAVDIETGELAWVIPKGGIHITSKDGYLFAHGRTMYKANEDGSVRELWTRGHGVKEYGVSYSHTIIDSGRLFLFASGTVKMIDAETGAVRAQLRCASPGSIHMAEGLLYVLDGRPRMTLARPTADDLVEVSSFAPDFTPDKCAYTHAVIAEGRLFLRHHEELRVYDLRRETANTGP
jgi:outer membrane protein assembly factor BamB